MSNVKELHEQMIDMSLGDLLILAGQAVNMKMPYDRLKLIFKYVEIAMVKFKLEKLKEQA